MRAKGGRPAGRFALCRMRHERKRNMLLFFLRHGDPIYDPDSLTELGRRQAEALGRRLAAYGLDRIFVSTSNRAVETALCYEKFGKNGKAIALEFFLRDRYRYLPHICSRTGRKTELEELPIRRNGG